MLWPALALTALIFSLFVAGAVIRVRRGEKLAQELRDKIADQKRRRMRAMVADYALEELAFNDTDCPDLLANCEAVHVAFGQTPRALVDLHDNASIPKGPKRVG